jgi:hypothetical protein
MLTEERIDVIFKEMDTYVLELASEPEALGSQYFQDIIATCRNYLNRVSLVISEVNREKLTVSSELRKLEAAYALEYDNLLANSDRVRSLASVEDRKATVGYMLRDQREVINGLKDQMHELESVYKVVSHRNRELHATMTAIKDQRRLMQITVDTGAFYGDERVPKSQRQPRDPSGGMALDDLNEKELADMLNEESSSEEPDAESAPEVPSEEEVKESEVLQFLDSSEKTPETPQSVGDTEQSRTTSDAVDDVLSILDDL